MQDDWDSQRKAAGAISDQCGQPQDEKKAVQKRTFTRWMNVFLERHDPSLEVRDLFTDIQDGRILMALLEELSGCKLLYRFRSSSHRIFRLNNISKALAFLDDRHVKLLGIDSSGIADGTPSVVLNLIWNVILHFQVKEVTGGLQRRLSRSLSSLSLSSYPSTSDLSSLPNDNDSYFCNTLPRKCGKIAREPKYHSKAIRMLLQWVQRCTSKYGVDVHDFGKSWRSGLAFLAMIKSVNPDLVDLRESLSKEPRVNIQQAFMIAHHHLDVPPLLEPEDVTCTSPDEQSIITYVSMFLGCHSGIDEDRITDAEVPEIPNFGSVDSVTLGETLADDPEAQALLKSFEKSSEQLLWRRWSRRSSGTSCSTFCNLNGAATSAPSASPRRVLQPPSPLDDNVASLENQAWMGKGLDWGSGEHRLDESHVSLSSEEGIYSLSALDSDEEDAYSYILDLNTEGFQSYNQQKRQVPRVEEETAEEMKEESKHLDARETFNGCRFIYQEGSVDQDADFNLESEVRAQSAARRKFHLDKNKSNLREMTNHRDVFDMEPEAERKSKEVCEEERAESAQSNDDGDCHEGEWEKKRKTARQVKDGYDKTAADVKKAKVFEVASWQRNVEDGGGKKLSEKWEHVNERKTVLEAFMRLEEGQNEREEVLVKEEELHSQASVNSESFKVKVKEEIFPGDGAYEVRNTDTARAKTEESDKIDNAVGKDVTMICKNGTKQEETDHVMNSSQPRPLRTAGGKNKEPENMKSKDLTATTAHPGEAPQKNHTDDVHEGDSYQTPACSAPSQSFRAQPMGQKLSPSDQYAFNTNTTPASSQENNTSPKQEFGQSSARNRTARGEAMMSVVYSSACLTVLALLTCSSACRPAVPKPEMLLSRLVRKEREASQRNQLNTSALNTALAFEPYRDLTMRSNAEPSVRQQQQHQQLNNILFSPSGLASALALLCRVSGPESRGRALRALGMAANSTQQSVEAAVSALTNLQHSHALQEGGDGGGVQEGESVAGTLSGAGIGGASVGVGNRGMPATGNTAGGRTETEDVGAQLKVWSSLHVDGKPSLDYEGFLSRPEHTGPPAFNTSFETLTKDLKGSDRLILKNFVYFKGLQSFDRRHTVPRSFHLNATSSVEVAMMFRGDSSEVMMLYDTNCSATVVRLAFSERLASLLLLPKGELQHLEDCLSDSRMSFWLSNLKPGRAEILLPKFQLRKSYSLENLLKNAGVSSIFSGTSQTKMLKITEAPHEVMLEVEESKSEGNGRPDTLLDFSVPQRITFDRPFMFIIYDDFTGFVLLIGRITDPTHF